MGVCAKFDNMQHVHAHIHTQKSYVYNIIIVLEACKQLAKKQAVPFTSQSDNLILTQSTQTSKELCSNQSSMIL